MKQRRSDERAEWDFHQDRQRHWWWRSVRHDCVSESDHGFALLIECLRDAHAHGFGQEQR